ncbi:MAG: hypothetical protein JSS14_02545 [Proteobacteria bacterium]|nr:hypothetical protein [Pseudomonadota bacterium]
MLAFTFARRAHRSRRTLPRHFAWLLWLALLVPLAQTVAACHVYSHTGELAAGTVDISKSKHSAGASHCDLCLAGSVVHAGGLPAAELLPALVHLHHAAPAADFDSPWTPPLALAYQGRAPPFALT